MGDLIVAVDGKSIAGKPADVSAARIKGKPGTEVEIRVEPASGAPRDVELRRAEVRLPAVDGEIRKVGPPGSERKVAYVRFATFSEGAHGELRETVERLYREGAEGLALDLRGNGGGLLNEAVLSAGLFVEDGVVVSTSSRASGDQDYQAEGEAIEPRPTVVLINRDTASAAEILAAALDDYGLATLVGTRTYGKNTVQEVLPLDPDGALDLTIGEYVTSEGDSLAGRGVRPEVERSRRSPDAPGRGPGRRPRRAAFNPGRGMSRAPADGERQVAVVAKKGRFRTVEPLFAPGPRAALLSGSVDARPGRMVLASFEPGGARALRELGSPQRASDVVAALIWDGGLERGFRPELETEAAEAAAAARERSAEGARRDLTALDTFTVDPATARDFDDAVSAQPDGDGTRLWIHIADVAAHVRPGSGLELEAYRRGTSTYVPGAVEPMLPAALSAEACSLAPGVERLAVTMEVRVSPGGKASGASFYRSRIRSDARLDYDQLDHIFAGRDRPPELVAGPLGLARGAAASLADRRRIGSLEIESFEPEFEFDSDGNVAGARGVEQTEAHRLIEHLMILTNEQVAQLLEQRRIPTLYRVHERPDPQRVAYLIEQLAALDVPTPPLPKALQPQDAGRVAAEASVMVAREANRRGHGRAAYTSLVLRSLKAAFYSHENIGHAGLGSSAYLHFTSPIRRYPDLVAHRGLLATLGAGEDEPARGPVAEAGPHSSDLEREATAIERRADRTCAAFLLERELFDAGWDSSFEGEVSGLVGGGAFVRFRGRLADVYEGYLPARLLRRDYYDLNETETALVGRRSGAVIRLGDPIDVRVSKVETARGRTDLEPAER